MGVRCKGAEGAGGFFRWFRKRTLGGSWPLVDHCLRPCARTSREDDRLADNKLNPRANALKARPAAARSGRG